MQKRRFTVVLLFSITMFGILDSSTNRTCPESVKQLDRASFAIAETDSIIDEDAATGGSDSRKALLNASENISGSNRSEDKESLFSEAPDLAYSLRRVPAPHKPRFSLNREESACFSAWSPPISLGSDGKIIISSGPFNNASIYYTRDGSTPSPDVYPNSSSLLYNPNAVIRTLIPITIKAVAVDPLMGTSCVSTMYPEDMMKTLYNFELSELGGRVVNEATLDAEIAFIRANGLWGKIAYLIGRDLGYKPGVVSTQASFYDRTSYVGFSFNDGASPATLTTAAQLEAVGARGTFFVNSHLIGRPNYITWADVANLIARGHFIADHGWSHSVGDPDYMPNIPGIPHVSDLEPKDIHNEFYQTDQDFVAHGLTPPIHYAVPVYRIDYQNALPIAAQYRRSIRGYNDFDYNILGDGTGYHQFNWNLYHAYSYASATEAGYQGAKDFINGAIAKNGVAFLATHSTNSGWFPELLNWIAGQGIQIKTYPQLYDIINSHCSKYVNLVKRNYEVIAHLDDFLALPEGKQGFIVFDCLKSELPGNVIEHYKGLGYNIAFWTDQSPEAFALLIPNNELFLDNVEVSFGGNNQVYITGKAGAEAKFSSSGVRPGVVLSGGTPPTGLHLGITYYAQGFGTHIRLYASPMGGSCLTFASTGNTLRMSTVDRFREKLYAYQCPNPKPADVTNLRCLKNITRLKYPNGSTSQVDIDFCGGDIADCGLSYFRNLWKLSTNGFFSGNADGTLRNTYRGYAITHKNGYLTSFLSQLITSGYLSFIRNLVLSNNELTETIPADIAKMTNLMVLDLSSNNISGAIPAELGTCVKLAHLFLNDNLISGTIPAALGNVHATMRIRLQNNSITSYAAGAISTGMKNLVEVNVSNNSISAQYQIDQLILDVLSLVRSGGQTTGVLHLGGVNNSPPSAAGRANIDILRGSGDPSNNFAVYNWTVTSN